MGNVLQSCYPTTNYKCEPGNLSPIEFIAITLGLRPDSPVFTLMAPVADNNLDVTLFCWLLQHITFYKIYLYSLELFVMLLLTFWVLEGHC